MKEHACGPNHDTAFFDAIDEVFDRFPEMATKYVIKCVDHETEIMNIDFNDKIGVSQIEGDRVVTEFRDRADDAGILSEKCCQWKYYYDDNGIRRRYCATAWWIPDSSTDS